MTSLVLQFDSKEEAFPVPVRDEDPGNAYISFDAEGNFQYTLYYHFNPAVGVFANCFPKSKLFGYHDHDIERLTIFKGGYIHMSAHSHTQGTWTSLAMLDPAGEEGYTIYVARGSHAMYPRKGTTIRGFGLANDVCDGKGKRMTIDFTNTCASYTYKIAEGFTLWKDFQDPSRDVLNVVQRVFIPLTL
jgi:hypothetical protein